MFITGQPPRGETNDYGISKILHFWGCLGSRVGLNLKNNPSLSVFWVTGLSRTDLPCWGRGGTDPTPLRSLGAQGRFLNRRGEGPVGTQKWINMLNNKRNQIFLRIDNDNSWISGLLPSRRRKWKRRRRKRDERPTQRHIVTGDVS